MSKFSPDDSNHAGSSYGSPNANILATPPVPAVSPGQPTPASYPGQPLAPNFPAQPITVGSVPTPPTYPRQTMPGGSQPLPPAYPVLQSMSPNIPGQPAAGGKGKSRRGLIVTLCVILVLALCVLGITLFKVFTGEGSLAVGVNPAWGKPSKVVIEIKKNPGKHIRFTSRKKTSCFCCNHSKMAVA